MQCPAIRCARPLNSIELTPGHWICAFLSWFVPTSVDELAVDRNGTGSVCHARSNGPQETTSETVPRSQGDEPIEGVSEMTDT